MTSRREVAYFLVPASVLFLGSCLVLYRLDERCLWSDEAETALLALSILKHGIPRIEPESEWLYAPAMQWVNEAGIWTWTPWLDKYVAAAAFAVLPPSPWSARLPFALLGIAGGALLMHECRRVYGSRQAALLSGLLFFGSLPILYHVRQCRYYSIAIFADLWMLHGYVSLLQGRRGSGRLHLSLALLCQFFSLTAMIITNTPGLLLAAFWERRRIKGLPWDAILALLPTAVGGGLWLAWSRPFAQGDNFSAQRMLVNAEFYFRWLDSFVLPVSVIGLLAAASFYRALAKPRPAAPDVRSAVERFLLLIALSNLLILSAIRIETVRYLAPLIGLIYLAAAGLIVESIPWTAPRFALVLTIVATSWLSFFPLPGMAALPRFGDYLREMTSRYDDPTEATAAFLAAQARPSDVVLAVDEELSLAFCTGLRFRCAIPPEKSSIRNLNELIDVSLVQKDQIIEPDATMRPLPDWIISESIGRTFGGRNRLRLPESWKGLYETVTVTAPDAPIYASDPDPSTRCLKPSEATRTILPYRRKHLNMKDDAPRAARN